MILRFSTHFTSLQTQVDDGWPSGYETRPDARRDRVEVRNRAQVESEVLRYSALAACDKSENLLEWWLAQRDSFALIEELATRVFSVQASSALSESLFYKARLTLTKKRMTLKSSRVAQLVAVRGAITSGLLDKH